MSKKKRWWEDDLDNLQENVRKMREKIDNNEVDLDMCADFLEYHHDKYIAKQPSSYKIWLEEKFRIAQVLSRSPADIDIEKLK